MSPTTSPQKNGTQSDPEPMGTLRPEREPGVELVTMPLLPQHWREGSRPQQRHREVTTIMVGSSSGFRMFHDLLIMCRWAASSRFVTGCCRFWMIMFSTMTQTSGARFRTTAPAISTHLDGLAPLATHALRAISGRS